MQVMSTRALKLAKLSFRALCMCCLKSTICVLFCLITFEIILQPKLSEKCIPNNADKNISITFSFLIRTAEILFPRQSRHNLVALLPHEQGLESFGRSSFGPGLGRVAFYMCIMCIYIYI